MYDDVGPSNSVSEGEGGGLFDEAKPSGSVSKGVGDGLGLGFSDGTRLGRSLCMALGIKLGKSDGIDEMSSSAPTGRDVSPPSSPVDVGHGEDVGESILTKIVVGAGVSSRPVVSSSGVGSEESGTLDSGGAGPGTVSSSGAGSEASGTSAESGAVGSSSGSSELNPPSFLPFKRLFLEPDSDPSGNAPFLGFLNCASTVTSDDKAKPRITALDSNLIV